MAEHPIIRFTNELMRLTDDLDQATAADFVQRVYNAGREDGLHEAAAEDIEQRCRPPVDAPRFSTVGLLPTVAPPWSTRV